MNTQAGRTPAGITTLVAKEYNAGAEHTTEITLTTFIVGTITGGAAQAMGNAIYAFPAGVQLHSVTYANLTFAYAGDAQTPIWGIGSVVGTGAVAVLNGTGTFMDYVTEQTAASGTGNGGTVGPIGATGGIHTGISLQTAAKVKNIFLNAAETWAANNAGSLTASGTIVLKWSTLA